MKFNPNSVGTNSLRIMVVNSDPSHDRSSDFRDNKFWIMEPQTSLAGKLGRPMILSELVPTELGLNVTLQVSLIMSPIIWGGGRGGG